MRTLRQMCPGMQRAARGKGTSLSEKEMETYVGTLHDRLLKDSDCRFVRHALKYVQQVQYAISLLIQMKQKRMLLCHAVMHALPIRIFRGTYDMSEVEIMMLPQQ